MDVLQDTTQPISRNTFIAHVFSTNEEDKAEFLNVIQYASMGILPIVTLNKLIQKFIPEADTEKSSLELLAEIFLQIIVIFCGVIIIHRIITYFPTYSGFKYDNLTLTNVILTFLIIVLSIQTKIGIKANILFDRVVELWEGEESKPPKRKGSGSGVSKHSPSQADHLDNSNIQTDLFPPAPIATTSTRGGGIETNVGFGSATAASASNQMFEQAPQIMAANSLLGNSFGSF